MMGTFNHIPRDKSKEFLRRIAGALHRGGLFLFSAWNPSSIFTEFLSLDGTQAKDK